MTPHFLRARHTTVKNRVHSSFQAKFRVMKRSVRALALFAGLALAPGPSQAIASDTPNSDNRHSPPASGPNTTPAYVAPNLLLPYLKYPYFSLVSDFRPTINAAGTRIVFERQVPGPKGLLYGEPYLNIFDLVTSTPNPAPMPLINTGQSAARADWCWRTDNPSVDGPITYSIYYDPKKTPPDKWHQNGIYQVEPKAGSTPTVLRYSDGTGWIYPTWYPGCGALAVDASTSFGYGPVPTPGPWTSKYDLSTKAVTLHITGQDHWAGFASVNPKMSWLITYAGQKFTENGYNQDLNQIYIANTSRQPPWITEIDKLQGRAPSWSPDGRYIAFESNRACPYSWQYAIFIADWSHSKQARQITDCKYNAQHAKWYNLPPGGKRMLIVSVLLYPDYKGKNELVLGAEGTGARGIASLDVTSYFNSP